MRYLPFGFLLIFVLLNTPCAAQRQHQARPTESGGALMPEQAAYDVHHYDIRLSVQPDTRRISGNVTVHAGIVDELDRFVLDLDDRLEVSRIEMRTPADAWQESTFDHDDGRLSIHLTETLKAGDAVQVRVHYGGEPRVAPNPPWVGGFTWAETASGEPWIATSVQMDGADLWLPVKDHPSDKPDSVRIEVTVPEGLVLASNGVLRNTTSTRDSTTFEWFTSQPINNYNIALNIAPYDRIDTTHIAIDGIEVPVSFWVLPERRADAARILPHFLDQLRWFEELLGPYPFRAEKYGIAHTPHLGMEHQTIIAYGSTFSFNEWDYDWLHHHELAHEWWANLVTAPDWNDFWLHEGFGTYMQPLYVEHLHGEEAYRQEMASIRGHLNNVKPVAPREPRSTTEMYFIEGENRSDNDIYYKGAWILHTLRYLIGDETFFEVLRQVAYPDREALRATDGSQVRFATTDDFQQLVEELSGLDLGWFFDVYLRQPELPRLLAEKDGELLTLRWDVPDDLTFPMPVEIEVDGQRRSVAVTTEGVDVRVNEGSSIAIDPDTKILMAD